MPSVEQAILDRLADGPATLAQLRSAFPASDAHARALPSMGEEDPFGIVLTALVNDGRVLDQDGRYRLAPSVS